MLGKQAKFNLLSFFSTVVYKNAQNANFSLKVIKIIDFYTCIIVTAVAYIFYGKFLLFLNHANA